MTPARRLFVLLGAYEDLTERETSALRRGDVDYAVSLQHRKARLTESISTTRRNTTLSPADGSAFNERLRNLEACEKANLRTLQENMAQTRRSLDDLNHTAHRTRSVRRGYTGGGAGASPTSASVLGRA